MTTQLVLQATNHDGQAMHWSLVDNILIALKNTKPQAKIDTEVGYHSPQHATITANGKNHKLEKHSNFPQNFLI